MKQLRSNPVHQPLLDQETLQQLLAAAYTLQQQNDRPLAKEVKADSQAKPLTSVTVPQPKIATRLLREPLQPSRRAVPTAVRARRKAMRRRISHSNDFFWRAATAVALAAVLALLLGASINRLSPLPGGLAPSEVVQQQLPFRRARAIVTVSPQNSVAGAKTIVIEPKAANSPPIDQEAVSGQPSGERAIPDSAPRTTANHAYSAYDDEADVVAQNTVVRYNAQSAGPRVPSQNKP